MIGAVRRIMSEVALRTAVERKLAYPKVTSSEPGLDHRSSADPTDPLVQARRRNEMEEEAKALRQSTSLAVGTMGDRNAPS